MRWGKPTRTLRQGGEQGAVTAETALVLPLLTIVTVAMIWMITVGIAQMTVTDAAREAARAVARGESPDVAADLAERAAPGVQVDITEADGTVIVRARRTHAGPGGVLSGLPGADVEAEAVAAIEDASSSGGEP